MPRFLVTCACAHAFILTMKKIINVRPAVLLAFAIGLGAGLSYTSSYYSFPMWWLIALVPVTAAFVIAFIILRKTKWIVLTVVCAALFLYGAVGVSAKLQTLGETSVANGAECAVSGVVYEKSFTESGEYIKINSVIADGERAEGNMIIYLDENYGEYCEVGYTVTFTGTVYVSEPFAYGVTSSERMLQDIRYTAYPQGALSSEYGFSLFGSINSAVRELFFENLSGDTAAIGYAMFTGNTEYIQTATMDSFRYGGVAHIFAVSGQHIALVYGVLALLFKKLRVPKALSAAISIAVVFFYTGVCGWTLSAVRSAIMCAVAAIVSLACGKYDGLSSVAISFVVINLINPLNVISVGFQLSVAAVAGIAVFNGPICRLLARIRMPQKVSAVISVPVSAQIATFPILLSAFGYVSWASLGLNIIFVPVISAIFLIMFPCTLLALIIQPISQFLLLIFSVPFELVTSLLVSIHAEKALISGFDFGAFAVLYFIAVFILSGMVNIKFRWRAVIAVVLAAAIAAGVVLKNYFPAGGAKIVVSAYYGGSYAVLIKTDEGSVLVISETPSSFDITSLLSDNGAEDLSAVVILGGEESIFAYTQLGAQCEEVYVNYTNINLQPYRGVNVHYERDFTVCGINFEYVTGNDVIADCCGASVGISCGQEVGIDGCDLLIAVQDEHDCNCQSAVYFDRVNFACNVYDCGDLQFIAKDGTISSAGGHLFAGAHDNL